MWGCSRAVRLGIAVLLVAMTACGSEDPPAAQPRPVPHIGFLSASASPATIAALREGLEELGYRDGSSMRLDVRTVDDEAQLPAIAAELVGSGADLIVAGGTRAIEAAKRATSSIPIVMTNSGDPVRTGLVQGMARPGGNVTGLTQSSPALSAKRLELLREAFPGLATVAVVCNPDHPTTKLGVEELEEAAPGLGMRLLITPVQDEGALSAAMAGAKASGAGAFVVLRDPFTIKAAQGIAAAAVANGLPAIYETRNFLDADGLMLYGPDLADLYRRSAGYVDKILRGAEPGSLPIGQPTKFELVINSTAATNLGVPIADAVRFRAEVVG